MFVKNLSAGCPPVVKIIRQEIGEAAAKWSENVFSWLRCILGYILLGIQFQTGVMKQNFALRTNFG